MSGKRKVKCDFDWMDTGHQVFYDPTTFETLHTSYPVQFIDDFAGDASDIFDGTTVWNVVDVNNATEAILENTATGVFQLALSAANEAQDAVLYMGDNRNFDAGNGLIFETRVDMAVSPGTGVVAVLGVANAHNLSKDTLAAGAWFRMDASLVLKVETDDTTNNNDDVATGITAVAATYNIFRIDMTSLSDVKFVIDGVRVASSTTFDMSNLTAAEQQMQPYFSLDKASGTGLGTMKIDYVKVFTNR